MKNKLVIVGVGETARLAYEYFKHDSDYEISAFAVNREYIKAENFCGLVVVAIEDLEQKYTPKDYKIFVALGSGHLNRDRTNLFQFFKNKGYECASYISSKAFVWHDVKIGENCFILENNVIQSGCAIGDNVTLWSGNHVGHLSRVDDNCFISSHVVISGQVRVGKNCFIGVNSAIADFVNIQDDNFIGLGTVINKTTETNGVYMGNPAVKSPVPATRFCKVKK